MEEEKKDCLMEKELSLYKDMFEHSPIGIIHTTLEGKVLLANPALARIFGYDETDSFVSSIKNIAKELYVDPDRRRVLVDLSLSQNQLLNFENNFRRKDGTNIICKVHVRTVRKEDGSVKFFESFIEDVTAQKRISEELEKSENIYRGIFENTGAGTIIIGKDMTILLANAGIEKLTGYSKEELEVREKWSILVAFPEELEMMKTYHFKRRTSSYNVPIEYYFTLKTKAGQMKNIFLRVDMIAGTENSVASLIDITSLKKAEISLRKSQSRLSGILEAFQGFIYICTEDYVLAYMNKSLKDVTGKHENGDKCFKVIYGLDRPCQWCDNDRIFKGDTVKKEFKSPKNARWYYAVNTPILDMDDKVVQMQAVLIDINERKMAEDAIMEREQYLKKENIRLRASIKDRYKFGGIIGKSPVMQVVYENILRAAAIDANVVIYGESGTGKELVAKAIHAASDRSRHRLVPVNCGAISQHLIESEFFGYKKGAFTGAGTDKPGYLDHCEHGTLFLDELGEINIEMQVKLLRVLEGNGFTPVGGVEVRKPDIRIIAATNRNLEELIEKGQMRKDFFYRIHIVPIYMPPLRSRKEDIPLLVEHFFEKYKPSNSFVPLAGNMMDALMQYDWPGNVRELENTLQRYLTINTLDFLNSRINRSSEKYELNHSMDGLTFQAAMKEFEKKIISGILTQTHWNRTQSAKILGMERKTLYLKMKSLGIDKLKSC